jgi:glutamate carboxypeptidase
MNSTELLDYFHKNNDRTVEKIRELVDIESPSFDFEGSCLAADWIENGFRNTRIECQTERISIADIGEHLIVRIDGESETKPILILGHSDTVHPKGSSNQNPTRIENGRLYGCGSFDMKANIALLIDAFGAFAEMGEKPKRPVNILIACDEEVGSETGRPIVEREALLSEYCLVFEPSLDGKLKTGRKGTGGYTLETHGIPSHAGLDPKKGASAVLEISRQITELHKLTDFTVGTTVAVGMVKGGTATNVIPAKAECTIDVRFETLDEAARIEKAIFGLKSFDPRVSLEISGEINRPPMERTEAVVRLFEKARNLASEFGYQIEETSVGGASDGNFVGALGVPVLDGLGIAGNGAHTLDEYIEIEDIPNRATLLVKLLLSD